MSGQGISTTMAGLSSTFATRSATAWDEFSDVANGALPTTTPTGHAWAYYYGARMEVQSGLLDNKATYEAAYAELDLGGPVTHMGAEFTVDTAGGTLTTDGALCLATWNDGGMAANGPGVPRTRCHFVITPHNAYLYARTVASGSLTLIWDYTLPSALTAGTYTVEFWLAGTSVVVALPDGTTHIVTNAGFDGDDRYACWEPYYAHPTTDVRFKVGRVWADAGVEDGQRGDSLALTAMRRTARTYTAGVTTTTPSPALTVTTSWQDIPNAVCTAVAGPTGKIIWDMEVPIVQTSGDGAVGAGSVWLAIAQVGGADAERSARASWEQANRPLRRRLVSTGLVPGTSYTRKIQVLKDTGGSGTTTVPASREVIITGTPA